MTKVTPQAIDQGQDDAIKLNKLVESFNQLVINLQCMISKLGINSWI